MAKVARKRNIILLDWRHALFIGRLTPGKFVYVVLHEEGRGRRGRGNLEALGPLGGVVKGQRM